MQAENDEPDITSELQELYSLARRAVICFHAPLEGSLSEHSGSFRAYSRMHELEAIQQKLSAIADFTGLPFNKLSVLIGFHYHLPEAKDWSGTLSSFTDRITESRKVTERISEATF